MIKGLFYNIILLFVFLFVNSCTDTSNTTNKMKKDNDPCTDNCTQVCEGNEYILCGGYYSKIENGKIIKVNAYENFRLTSEEFDDQANRDLYLTDDDCNLKPEIFDNLKVTAIKVNYDGSVQFRVHSLNIDIYGFTNDFDYIESIIPVSQIECAKKKWLGKYIHVSPKYFKESLIPSKRIELYSQTNKQKREITLADSLKVIYVSLNNSIREPIKLRVITNDGFISDVEACANKAHTSYKDQYIYEKNAYTEWENENKIISANELLKYNWSDAVWDAVRKGEIIKGMPKEALFLNWGNPDDSLSSRLANTPKVYIYWGNLNDWDCHVYIQNDIVTEYKLIYDK